MPITLGAWWEKQRLLSPVQRFRNFLAEEVVPHIGDRLVVFIDEIDQTLELDYSDGFSLPCGLATTRGRGPRALTL